MIYITDGNDNNNNDVDIDYDDNKNNRRRFDVPPYLGQLVSTLDRWTGLKETGREEQAYNNTSRPQDFPLFLSTPHPPSSSSSFVMG